MLTDRQLTWFDSGERSSLETFYREGNRGRPWGRVTALDTMRTRKVAHATGPECMEQVEQVVRLLAPMPDAEAIFLTYVGMTALPEKKEWLSQKQVQEMILSGDPESEKAGRALFTVATDVHGFIFAVISRFEVVGENLVWGKRMANVLTPVHVADDEMLGGLVRSLEGGRKALKNFVRVAESERGETLPKEMEMAATAIASASMLKDAGLRMTLRYRLELDPVREMLEKYGVTFYEESRG